jgi:hypothetical protein
MAVMAQQTPEVAVVVAAAVPDSEAATAVQAWL